MRRQLEKSNVVNPIDTERSGLLAETDTLALKSLKAVAKAVIDKAKLGDKTCAELFFKYLHAPIRQEHSERIAHIPQPVGVNVQTELMVIRTNCGLSEPPATELTQPEAAASTPQLPETTTKALNRTCPCGIQFWSNQPLAKYCAECKKSKSLARLLASKQKRAERLLA
jgi:hypothetical protein